MKLTTAKWEDSLITTATKQQVAVYFEDPTHIMDLSPQVIAYEKIEQTDDYYNVTDQLTVMGFSYTHQFKARLYTSGADIFSEAWSFPKIHIKTRFSHRPHPQGTEVLIETELTTPAFIMRYTKNAAQGGRVGLLANLKQALQKIDPQTATHHSAEEYT